MKYSFVFHFAHRSPDNSSKKALQTCSCQGYAFWINRSQWNIQNLFFETKNPHLWDRFR